MTNTKENSVISGQRRWVWFSSEQSVADGQISVLAVAETLISVAVYFWLAQHFERQWWWLLTALAAPILLLRSDESKELGLRWFTKYFKGGFDERPLTRTETGLMTLSVVMLIITISYWLASIWLVEYQGRFLLWRSLLIGAIVLLLGIAGAVARAGTLVAAAAFAGAGAGAGAVAVAGAREEAFAGVVGGAIAAALVVGVAGAFAVAGKLTVAIAEAFAVAVAVAVAFAKAKAKAVAVTLAVAGTVSIALGVWVRSLLIRIMASLRYCRSGLANLPNNWQQLLWVVDVKHEPELLPGLNQIDKQLSLSELLRNDDKYFAYPLVVIFYLPALLWRWSLKSTLWMWWPVALLLRQPLAKLSPELLRDHAASRVCGVGQALVYCAGLIALWLLVNQWPNLQQWLAVLPEPWSKIGGDMLTKQAPPPIGIRYGLLCLVSGLGLMTAWQSDRLKAIHKSVLEDDSKFTELNAGRQNLFATRTRHLEHWHTATVVSLIALGYAVVMWKGQQLYPQEIARYLHPWLLQHL
ncbi:hypothetical protein [Methylomonas sp. MK1]|uniref:hypothetical protein n=1 Tax=Methylomonas sp. MK1 TaxID=1131552 RepID=UPI0003A70210|nr:hypothetical protein [Methylomonas sp. MK1]